MGNSSLSDESRDHHIYLLSDMKTPAEDLPEKWEFYSDRGIDATVVDADDGVHIYFKFPKMFFVSCVSPESIDGFDGTEVSDSGKIEPPQKITDPEWGSFLLGRSDLVTGGTSDDEVEKIIERISQNPEEAIESDSFQTFQKEQKRKIESHKSTDYLNQECPVCGIKHIQIDSISSKPLTESGINALEQSESVEQAEGILMLPGTEFGLSTSKDVTGAIILALQKKTYLVNLYTDTGWVVDRELPYPEGMTEEELDRFVEMLVEEFEEYYRENILPGV